MDYFVLAVVIVIVPAVAFMWLKAIEEREQIEMKKKWFCRFQKNEEGWVEIDFHPIIDGKWTDCE